MRSRGRGGPRRRSGPRGPNQLEQLADLGIGIGIGLEVDDKLLCPKPLSVEFHPLPDLEHQWLGGEATLETEPPIIAEDTSLGTLGSIPVGAGESRIDTYPLYSRSEAPLQIVRELIVPLWYSDLLFAP